MGIARPMRAVVIIGFVVLLGELAWILARRDKESGKPSWFGIIERRPLTFTVLTLVAILIGGMAELLPTLLVKQAVPGARRRRAEAVHRPRAAGARPLRPRGLLRLPLADGPLARPRTRRASATTRSRKSSSTTTRFSGGRSAPAPTCTALGGRYPNLWHYAHLLDPRSTSPGSNMPSYTWLESGRIDVKLAPREARADAEARRPLHATSRSTPPRPSERAQADAVVTDLAAQGVTVAWDSELVALISYLQRLGRDVGVKPVGPRRHRRSAAAVPQGGR